MNPILRISDLSKTYTSGVQALKPINLDVQKGEIFALLGPNGAGKTTLISIVCGIVTASTGSVTVDGFDAWDGDTATILIQNENLVFSRNLFEASPDEILNDTRVDLTILDGKVVYRAA